MDPAASKRAGKQGASIFPTSTTGQKIQPSQPQPSQPQLSQPQPFQPQPSQPRPSQPRPSPYAPTAALPTAAPSQQDRAQSQNPSKVAIPRLSRHSGDQSPSQGPAAADRNRVAHACESCRQRKSKCSGERPRCQHCEAFNLPCVYVDGKRDKTRK